MNHTAIENKIEKLKARCNIGGSRWQEILDLIHADWQGDNNHLLLLMNIYAMFTEMGMNTGQRRSKIREMLGISALSVWSLSNTNAKVLQKSLVPEYQQHLREKRADGGVKIKVTNHAYELHNVATGETIGFDDQLEAINRGYWYDGQNSHIKVLSVDGVVYRLFVNGVMFEPVDCKEWR